MSKSYNGAEQINTFHKGMNMDLDTSNIQKDTYIYGQNVRVIVDKSNTTGVLQAMEGIRELYPNTAGSLDGETIIGVAVIRDLAVIFTENITTKLNSIYRFALTGAGYSLTKLTTQSFNIGRCTDSLQHMSIETKWEDDDNIKVYWVDGCNQLRVINIWEGMDDDNLNAAKDYFESIPNITFNKPEFVSFGAGALKCGTYQYAYQLFSINGGKTILSPLSNMIHLTASNTRDVSYTGNSSEDSSTKSVRMKIAVTQSSFNEIRVYALRYASFDSVPEVRMFLESSLDGDEFVFVDNGTVLSEPTWEEFSTAGAYSFIPRVIESKDDRLFAANIVEDTWSIASWEDDDYFDTRAFAFNVAGEAYLYDESDDVMDPDAAKVFTIQEMQSMSNSEWKNFLKENHDCINAVNYLINEPIWQLENLEQGCFYGLDGNKGAVGRNISLKIIHTMLGESSQDVVSSNVERGMGYVLNPDGKLKNIWDSFNNYEESLDLPYWYNLPSDVDSQVYDGRVKYKNEPSNDRCINYANEKIDGSVKSFQRDSLYRLGVIFYNERGQTTPVYWVCDVRIPSMYNEQHRLFDQNKIIHVGESSSGPVFVEFEVATYPIGFEFSFPNGLPEGTTAVEIVRCEREPSDRNIIAQGILSSTANWNGTSVRSNVFMTLCNNLTMSLGNENPGDMYTDPRIVSLIAELNSNDKPTQPFVFASPEISISRDKFDDGLNSNGLMINPIYGLISPHKTISVSGATTPAIATSYATDLIEYPRMLDGALAHNSGRIGVWTRTLPHAYGMVPSVMVSKYFNPFNETPFLINNRYTVNQFKIAQNIDPRSRTDSEHGKFTDAVGGYSYTNWAIGENQLREMGWDDYNRDVKEGPHGVTSVFSITSDTLLHSEFFKDRVGGPHTTFFGKPNITYDIDPTVEDAFMALNYTLLTNLLQTVMPYGGLSYTSRSMSRYICTNSYKRKDEDLNKFPVFGGDTYLGIHDYCVTYPFYTDDNARAYSKTSIFAYFPCESSINLSLTHGANFHSYTNKSTYPTELCLEPTVSTITGFVQDSAMYGYNTAYSSNPIGKIFLPKGLYSEDDKHFDYRVHYSESKELDSIYDNWLDFKPANYKDVDTRFGPINNMYLFKNELFFWQDDAFGVLSVNPRSLIQDNNLGALQLGTGDIIERYDYISTHNGSKKNMINNIVATPSTLFWYDFNRAEVLTFEGGLNTISKIKGVQSHMNTNKNYVSDHLVTAYDKKYNDVYFKFNYSNNDIDDHLVYNEQVGGYVSFTTSDPDWYLDFKNKLVSTKDNRFYKHNDNSAGVFYGIVNDTIIKYIVNDNYPYTKVYDNVNFEGDVDSVNVSNVNFVFNTKTQTSNTIDRTGIDKREDTYRFAIPRESKTNSGRMRGKHLQTDITILPTDNNFKISYVKTIYRISNI